jgi:broad specificity phosphatase PhoE
VIEQLILVRHGETTHNASGITQGWQDSELSELGRRQVNRLAERLLRFEPDALFSSPLRRAMTTAEAIRGKVGLEIMQIDDLREMNYGSWEGRSFLDIRSKEVDSYRRWRDEPEYRCPDGESHQDVLVRMKRALDAVSTARRPVVVTHGTAIRIGATAILDLPLLVSRQLAQDNAAINIFIRRGDRFILKVWNDATHCAES